MKNSIENSLDQVFRNLIPNIACKNLPMIKTDKIKINYDFIYPNTLVQLRPGNGKEGEKMIGGPKYIVIHDTGMVDQMYSAAGLNKYIHEQANSINGRVASWHFSIDDQECYQHVPTTEIAWHAGDGKRIYGEKYFNQINQAWCIGGGNQNGIGIETCINKGGNYDLTLKRTAQLVAHLLITHQLPVDAVKEHYNFSGKKCPNIIRSIKGRMQEFLNDVETIYKLINISDDIKIKWYSSNENVIDLNGTVKPDILDTKVLIECTVEIEKKIYKYQYHTLVKGMSVKKRLERGYCKLYATLPKLLCKDQVLPKYIEKYQIDVIWLTIDNQEISSLADLSLNSNQEVLLNAKLKANEQIIIKKFVFEIK